MSEIAVRCERIGKRFSPNDVAPYQGLRAKLHQLAHGAARTAPAQGQWALRDVSFELAAGRILGVVGRNGSGKSVLLRILARVTKPTEGRSVVAESVSSILNLVAMLDPELTGRENIFQTGTLLRLRRATIARRFDEIVAFAGVGPHLDAVVRGYSAGMQLRLAFAVIAHLESEVVLIDEALAVGDEEFRERCVQRLAEMARAGTTVVLVSHDMDIVGRLCDRVLILEGGQLRAFGDVRVEVPAYLASYPHRIGTAVAVGT
jgi:lipopolysaccharide transport system ATP-binding protein